MKNVNFNVEHQRRGENSRQWLDDLYAIAHMTDEEENDNGVIYVDDEDFSRDNDEVVDDYIEYVDCDETFFDNDDDDLYLGDGFMQIPMGVEYYEEPIVIDEDYVLDEFEVDIAGQTIEEPKVKDEEKTVEKKEVKKEVKRRKEDDITDVLCQSQDIMESLKSLYSKTMEEEGDFGKKYHVTKDGGEIEDIVMKLMTDKDYDPGIIELPKQASSIGEETSLIDNERLEKNKIAQAIANEFMLNIQSSASPLEAEEIEEEENNMSILKSFEEDIFGNDLSVVIVPETEHIEVEDYDYVDGSFNDWVLANGECSY